MDIGESWAYRERIRDPDSPLIQAEILQFGPPRSSKVRVKMHGGEYPGLDMWVPKIRLMVRWEESQDWLRDEASFAAAREVSIDALETPEYEAASLCIYALPLVDDDNLLVGWGTKEGATVRISNLCETAAELRLDPDALLAEPLAFMDRHSEYVAPWTVAKKLALHIASTSPERVLASVAKEQKELQERAVQGHVFEWPRGKSTYIPPEQCAENLAKREPVFELVRRWCGTAATDRFDELSALRQEVVRLRELIERAAQILEDRELKRAANRLRRALDDSTGVIL